jgi:hypothetical protein
MGFHDFRSVRAVVDGRQEARGGLPQELAWHADLTTTQRYMHLSPAATEDAIRLLDGRASDLQSPKIFGDILDTRSSKTGSE